MWSKRFSPSQFDWPNSIKVIRRDLGHLPLATQTKVLAANVSRLYGLDMAALPAGVSRRRKQRKRRLNRSADFRVPAGRRGPARVGANHSPTSHPTAALPPPATGAGGTIEGSLTVYTSNARIRSRY